MTSRLSFKICCEQGQYEKLLHYCLTDAKLVFNLCQQKDMKIMNAQDRSASLTIEGGKWIALENETPKERKRPSAFRRKPPTCMPQGVAHPFPIINPEKLDWVFIVNNEKL